MLIWRRHGRAAALGSGRLWLLQRFLVRMAPPTADDDKRRALLFGARADASAYRRSTTAPRPGATAPYAAAEQEMIEQSNSEKVDGLRGQVGHMRHVRYWFCVFPA